MSEFKVVSDVKMPEARKATKKYPFAEMEIGNSFEIADLKTAKSVSTSASSYGKRHGLRFSVRKSEDGSVWNCFRVPVESSVAPR